MGTLMGTASKRPGRTARSIEDRILGDSIKQENGCWLWPGAPTNPKLGDYRQMRVGSRTDGTRRRVLAHVASYEALVGPIPAGLELDHLCRVHACVNPEHLEPVTHQENMRRYHEASS